MTDIAGRLAFAAPSEMLARIRARYDEPHRRYHTWRHVIACFDARDALTPQRDVAVDLALLFHDAIYDPLSRDNEAQSAAWLASEAASLGIDPGVIQSATDAVLATRHDAFVDGARRVTGVVLDADLSILGAAPDVFAAYERDVRAEYAIVDDATFHCGRAAVLRSFLARPRIFVTEGGHALWEDAARNNLASSLAEQGA